MNTDYYIPWNLLHYCLISKLPIIYVRCNLSINLAVDLSMTEMRALLCEN